jgi:hypothetical protein
MCDLLMPADGDYFEPGMLVALRSGRVGIIRRGYDFQNGLAPHTGHRRFKVEIGPGHLIDVGTQGVIGRVTFRRAHLRLADTG